MNAFAVMFCLVASQQPAKPVSPVAVDQAKQQRVKIESEYVGAAAQFQRVIIIVPPYCIECADSPAVPKPKKPKR